MNKTELVAAMAKEIVCPGGFATLDEMFELLTLVQTHKIGRASCRERV